MRLTPFLLMIALLAACAPAPAATPAAPPHTLPTPTRALTHPPEVSPAPSASPIPTRPPAPTPTPTPAPTRVPRRYVVTEFFYWYDPLTRAHMNQRDPLSLTLPGGALPDWHDPEWYYTEFADMLAAGIDIAACGYWTGEAWSDQALPVMAAALERLAGEGKTPPGLAMFYETVPLDSLDLTTPAGQAVMYANIHAFFAAIPPKFWGRIDGRPVIWYYSTALPPSRYNQSSFDYVYERFTTDFGERPYIVLDRSWDFDRRLRVDGIYTWGVAYLGFQPRDDIAGAGPGMDDHLVYGRNPPVIVPREDGRYYETNLYYALASGKDILWLETWNEHHEATNINHTAEYGRQYIDITRRYVDWFRQGIVPPRPAGGPYASAQSVQALFPGADGQWDGLRLLDVPGDGLWEAVEAGGGAARRTAGSLEGRYLYFEIEDDFAFFAAPVSVRVEVEYYDEGAGALILQYDSYEPGRPDRLEDHYCERVVATYRNTRSWQTAAVTLRGVRFANGQNMGADLRFWSGIDRETTLRRVTVTKIQP